MDRVRGGVLSGAMLLAGLSATVLSGLIAIGIRQATMTASRPVQVTVQHASGEVAVPDARASISPSAASGVAEPSLARAHTYRSVGVTPRAATSQGPGTTTGSATAGGSLKAPAPTPAPTATPTATATAARGIRHARGNGKGTTKGAGSGPTSGPTASNGNGHHH